MIIVYPGLGRGLEEILGKKKEAPKIGLGLSGGGIYGFAMMLGTMLAIEEATNISFSFHQEVSRDKSHIVMPSSYGGISAGAIANSLLANGFSLLEMITTFVDNENPEHKFKPGCILKADDDEYRRAISTALSELPNEILHQIAGKTLHSSGIGDSHLLVRVFEKGLPRWEYEGGKIDSYLRMLFSKRHRPNDFRELGVPLHILAHEVSRGGINFDSDLYGEFPTLSISWAADASSAMFGYFPYQSIRDAQGYERIFQDGIASDTGNAHKLLEDGAGLIIGINPMVPVINDEPGAYSLTNDIPLRVRIQQGLSAMNERRGRLGLLYIMSKYHLAVQLLFEPSLTKLEDIDIDLFSFSKVKEACQKAYIQARADIHSKKELLKGILDHFGVVLNENVLETGRHSYREALEFLQQRRFYA